jgi:hypothetical protein
MAEQVVPWDPGVKWAPNDPGAVLAVSDSGQAALALNAHFDDANQRPSPAASSPNDLMIRPGPMRLEK